MELCKLHPLQVILQKAFQCYPRDDGCLTVEGGDIGDVFDHLNRYETDENKPILNIAASKVILIPSGAIVFPLVKFVSTRTVYTEAGGQWLVEVLSNERKDLEDGRFQVVKLRCLKTLRKPRFHPDIPQGTVWEAQAREGFEAYVGWFLRPDLFEDFQQSRKQEQAAP